MNSDEEFYFKLNISFITFLSSVRNTLLSSYCSGSVVVFSSLPGEVPEVPCIRRRLFLIFQIKLVTEFSFHR